MVPFIIYLHKGNNWLTNFDNESGANRMKRRIALALAAASMASGQHDMITSQRSSMRGPPPSQPQDASDGVRSWGNSHDAHDGIQTGEGYWSSSQRQQSSGYDSYGASPRHQGRDSANGDVCRSTSSMQTLRCNDSSCAPVYHGGCDLTSEFTRSSTQSRCEMPDVRLAGSSAICYYEDVCCPRSGQVVTSSGFRGAAAPVTSQAERRLGDEWFQGGDVGNGVDSTYQNYLYEKYGLAATEEKSSENTTNKSDGGGGNGVGSGVGFAVCMAAFVAFQVFVHRKSRRGNGGGGAEDNVPRVLVGVTRALSDLDDESTAVSSTRNRKPKNSGKKKKEEEEEEELAAA
ncbi:hypothetical protein THAOC_02749 [Thalassiosira oceanica]|uniref:Uncharacterized protein n=1 Tax=Thalassiosira oceanica TaxID=159749 RepID=K0TEG7_THAOC|nr:hypothetical protein THAOC_02749 [Thalassiosira oceanica]|eukprot:EJK75524.1 hypothetical protein THAOC_02749 [Thalassiosira oceanica]